MARRNSSASSAGFNPGSGNARTPAGDPLAGVTHAYIDGSNLLHALARGGGFGRGRQAAYGDDPSSGAGSSTSAPAGAVIGRLRAAFPPSVVVDLVFDGPAVGGIRGRLATGLRVSYSGRLTADHLIYEAVASLLASEGPASTWALLVVTDDRRLRDEVTAKGARTAGTAWLGARIGRLGADGPAERPPGGRRSAGPPVALPKAGTTIGHRRPPRAATPDRD